MLFWGTFPTNHLELLLPSHNTYGRLLVEYLEHSRCGGSVPNHGFPDYAGGHVSFGAKGYVGATAWLSQNFYDDFQYTRDAVLLESITYPMLAAFADYLAGELWKGPDGLYHCIIGFRKQGRETGLTEIRKQLIRNRFFGGQRCRRSGRLTSNSVR